MLYSVWNMTALTVCPIAERQPLNEARRIRDEWKAYWPNHKFVIRTQTGEFIN